MSSSMQYSVQSDSEASFSVLQQQISFSSFVASEENPQIFEYRFIRFLGRGSHAEVYLAKHILEDRYYAAKVYDQGFLTRLTIGEDESPCEKVFREVQVMSVIDDPRCVRLKEVVQDLVSALPDMMVSAFSSMRFDVNNREFARLVKAVN